MLRRHPGNSTTNVAVGRGNRYYSVHSRQLAPPQDACPLCPRDGHCGTVRSQQDLPLPGKYGAGFHLDLPEVLSPKVGGLGCVVLAARSPRALRGEKVRNANVRNEKSLMVGGNERRPRGGESLTQIGTHQKLYKAGFIFNLQVDVGITLGFFLKLTRRTSHLSNLMRSRQTKMPPPPPPRTASGKSSTRDEWPRHVRKALAPQIRIAPIADRVGGLVGRKPHFANPAKMNPPSPSPTSKHCERLGRPDGLIGSVVKRLTSNEKIGGSIPPRGKSRDLMMASRPSHPPTTPWRFYLCRPCWLSGKASH
ncbi:hypothetical protein CH63R_08781 [Colletotrichum higginsianum IMI 349063]|uniref:Uncharacterized protein n=1 Tax=Colletotrichum higginsianum (strain IMI 349063) TaxID=759273 RepID=A0A1B7Y5F7_COLHI|nr:hypothetical protein CH63R_08781 [Colletotrichum higginsianum IMI 349063]OBR07260.1 hypothetical protein CH63R_08781 [Colletotrichum higginsianum IMI 349063]